MRRFLTAITAFAGLYTLLRLRPERFEVVDRSMEPTLSDGDYVLTVRGKPRLGDVVVTNRLNAATWSIKRLVAGPGDAAQAGELADDEWLLVGDNRRDSVDGRHVGPVLLGPAERRVVARYWPQPRFMG